MAKKRIHPYKFAMWLSMGSMTMLFAGLTSAYIFKRQMIGWKELELPSIFYFSTIIIIASSITLNVAKSKFKQKKIKQYRQFLILTLLLGALFIIFQISGFVEMVSNHILLNNSVSGSFVYVLTGAHLIHLFGGLVALAVFVIKSYKRNRRSYSSIGIEVLAIFWNFVDFLWIYILIFFLILK